MAAQVDVEPRRRHAFSGQDQALDGRARRETDDHGLRSRRRTVDHLRPPPELGVPRAQAHGCGPGKWDHESPVGVGEYGREEQGGSLREVVSPRSPRRHPHTGDRSLVGAPHHAVKRRPARHQGNPDVQRAALERHVDARVRHGKPSGAHVERMRALRDRLESERARLRLELGRRQVLPIGHAELVAVPGDQLRGEPLHRRAVGPDHHSGHRAVVVCRRRRTSDQKREGTSLARQDALRRAPGSALVGARIGEPARGVVLLLPCPDRRRAGREAMEFERAVLRRRPHPARHRWKLDPHAQPWQRLARRPGRHAASELAAAREDHVERAARLRDRELPRPPTVCPDEQGVVVGVRGGDQEAARSIRAGRAAWCVVRPDHEAIERLVRRPHPRAGDGCAIRRQHAPGHAPPAVKGRHRRGQRLAGADLHHGLFRREAVRRHLDGRPPVASDSLEFAFQGHGPVLASHLRIAVRFVGKRDARAGHGQAVLVHHAQAGDTEARRLGR